MKVFYLLKNGEIKEGEDGHNLADYDSLPTEIDGIKVLAAANTKEGIDGVRAAIFADEESLIGTRKNTAGLTPVDAGDLKERGYGSA